MLVQGRLSSRCLFQHMNNFIGLWALFEHPECVHSDWQEQACCLAQNSWLVKFCSIASLFPTSKAGFLTFTADKPFATVNIVLTFFCKWYEIHGLPSYYYYAKSFYFIFKGCPLIAEAL